MSTLEPRQPEAGWSTRWLVQGCALIARSALVLIPGSIVFAVAAFAAMAAPITLMGPMNLYGLPVLIGAFCSRFIAGFYLLWVIGVLMAEDGHTPKVRIFTLAGIRQGLPFALGSAVFGAAMYGQVVSMMLQGVGMPEGAPTSIADFIDLISFAGGTMSASMADVIMFAGRGLYVWPVLLISVGASWRDCMGLATRLLSRLPVVMACFFFLSLSLSVAAITLPLWSGFPLELAWIAWIYVATREIFAGIVKNGARETVEAGERIAVPT
mgnify:FL=1